MKSSEGSKPKSGTKSRVGVGVGGGGGVGVGVGVRVRVKVRVRVRVWVRARVGVRLVPESRVPARMAMAVAKHLTMLSAYFIVAATSRPPAELSSTWLRGRGRGRGRVRVRVRV